MEIYRLADTVRTMPGIPPSLVSNRYFRSRRRALQAGSDLALQYVQLLGCTLVWTPVDRYGVVCLWRDHPIDPSVEIRIDKGGVEDVAEMDS